MKAVAERSTSSDSTRRKNLPRPILEFPPLFSSAPVGEALQRKFSCACGGGCPRCQSELAAQAKLAVSQPGDIYEREADRVAEEVMRIPDPHGFEPALGGSVSRLGGAGALPHGAGSIQRQTWSPYSMEDGLVEEEGEEEETESVQAKETPGGRPVVGPGVAGRIESLRGHGEPLSAPVRTFMETRFGRDFSRVHVHTGTAGTEAAALVNARAFTLGENIVFGASQYAPASEVGKRLIAHELAHVVQQDQAPGSSESAASRARDSPAQGFPQAPGAPGGLLPGGVNPGHVHGSQSILRVKWHPNTATGKTSLPWGTGPSGDVLSAATDAGTSIDIWRPHNRKTYWCHGYTFGGVSAKGGPYSLWGIDVPTVLGDDGWQETYSCMARPRDILVFWDADGILTHSGIIRRVGSYGGTINEAASTLESKWGNGPHNTNSWRTNAAKFGKYRCYSKSPVTGVCNGTGANEL